MRFFAAIVFTGAVSLAATVGCTKAKPAGEKAAQRPPQVDLGEPVAGGAANQTVPRRPDAEPAVVEPKAVAESTADVAAPGATALADIRKAWADATDEDGRVRAIDQLAGLGQNALPALDDLVKALADDNVRIKWHAARAVGAIGEDSLPALPKLVALLADADPIVATQSAAAIAAIRADDGRTELPADAAATYASAADALAAATVHPDARVRRAALRAVSTLRPEADKLAALVGKQLADADPAVVMQSLQSLADLGAQAVPMLVESLKDPKARYWATVALTEIGPDAAAATDALTAAATSGEPEERMHAMLALAAIGEPAVAAADALTAVLDSPDTAVRSAAAFALGRMRGAGADAALEKASADADPFLAGIASWARARIHPDDKDLVSKSLAILSTSLDGDRPNTKIAALEALSDLTGSLDDADETALSGRFVALLEDQHPGVRGAAAAALARLGPTAVDALEKALSNPAVRTVALELLAAAGSNAKPAVDALAASLGDADPAVRGDAALALAAVGGDAAEAVPALATLIDGAAAEDPTKYAAVYALGRIGPAAKTVAAKLRSFVSGDDPMLATVAAWALLKIEPDNKEQIPTAVPLLRKALRSENDNVRLQAVLALGELGTAAQSAVPMLELMSEDDPLPSLRKAAAAAAATIKAAH